MLALYESLGTHALLDFCFQVHCYRFFKTINTAGPLSKIVFEYDESGDVRGFNRVNSKGAVLYHFQKAYTK